MNTQKSTLMILAVMILMALVATGCKSTSNKEALQNGLYKRAEFTLLIEDGQFSISGDSDPLEKGSYTIDGDKISFNTEEFSPLAEPYCGKFPTYTYQWAFDPETQMLSLTVVDDGCDARMVDFIKAPLAYSAPQK